MRASMSHGPSSHHRRGEGQRRRHAGGTGAAAAGEVVGGAVIGRRAHDGQAEGDVDRVLEVDQLHRDERLVVVHRDQAVDAPVDGEAEGGVGHQRAGHLRGRTQTA